MALTTVLFSSLLWMTPSTAWVSEGRLSFFFDLARKAQSPSVPFRIYTVDLSPL